MSISTPFPLLRSDHKILGSEYCSGYSDVFGKWNTGFYCPQSESKTAVSCCGTPTYKYCCTVRDPNENEIQVALAPYFIRTPVIIGIVGVLFLVLFLIILTSCYFCSCCFFYKKRRAHLPGSLYRMPLASSSTTSALMNTYSTSSNFSNSTTLPTTPLDIDWTHFQQTNICNNNHINRTSLQNNLSNVRPNQNGTLQSNNVTNAFVHADLLQQYISAHNLQSQNNQSNYRYSTLPRYFHHHQTQNQNLSRPPSTLMSGTTMTPPRLSHRASTISSSDNSSSSTNNTPNRVSNPQSYIGYTISAESRPYLISTNFNSHLPVNERPRSVINLRNNVAYITSTLPLTNSFTTGRRTVHFRDSDVFLANSPSSPNPVHNGTRTTPSIQPTTQLSGISETQILSCCPIENESSSSILSMVQPQVLPVQSVHVTSPNGPNLTTSPVCSEVNLKVTSTSPSKPLSFLNSGGGSMVRLTGGATGDETTGRSLDTDLFSESMTGSTAFGMGPDNSDTGKSQSPLSAKPEFPIPTPTSAIPTTQLQSPPPPPLLPQHQPLHIGGHPEESHYKVLSSSMSSTSPPMSMSNSPNRVNSHSNRKNTSISQRVKSSIIPIETHRIVL